MSGWEKCGTSTGATHVIPQAAGVVPRLPRSREISKINFGRNIPQISVSKIQAPIDITGSAANSFLIRQIFRKDGLTWGRQFCRLTFILHYSHQLLTQNVVKENYEGYLTYKVTDTVTQQPLVAGHDTTHHIKAIDVPFHLMYGSLISDKR